MRGGYTLFELIIAMALLIVIAAVGVIWIDPAGQLARARNARRVADVNAISIAIGANIADNRGTFACGAGAIPLSPTRMATGTGNYNIAPCIAPAYLHALPYDPTAPGASYASVADYNTAYTVNASSTTGAITVAAPYAESGEVVTVTR